MGPDWRVSLLPKAELGPLWLGVHRKKNTEKERREGGENIRMGF